MDFAFTPEQDELIRTLRAFARRKLQPRSAHWDRTGEFPAGVWRQMGELGLLGLRPPAAYGGQDADFMTFGIAMEEIARGDFSCTYGVQLASRWRASCSDAMAARRSGRGGCPLRRAGRR